MSSPSQSRSSWSKGLRPEIAILSEVVRIIIAVFLVITLVFVAFRIWANDPALSLAPHNPAYQGLWQANVRVFALDQPMWVQYPVWVFDVFTGNLGISYFFRRPVASVVLDFLPRTLELVLTSAILVVALGGALGWASSSRRHPVLAHALRKLGLTFYAIPVFWLVLTFVYIVSYSRTLNLGFPLGQSSIGPPRVTGFFTIDSLLAGDWSGFLRSIASNLVLALPTGLAFCLPMLDRVRVGLENRDATRSSASALKDGGLTFASPFWASVSPLLGELGVLFPFLLSSTMLSEIVSNRQGLGWLLAESLPTLDVPVLQATFVEASFLAVGLAVPFLLAGAWFHREAPVSSAKVFLAPARGSFRDVVKNGFRQFGLRLRSSPAISFWIGIVLFAIPVGLALGAPLLSPYSPTQAVTDSACGSTPSLQPPCAAHPLGTNYMGQDNLSRVLWGGWYALAYTGVALGAAAGIGLAIGLTITVLGRVADASARIVLGAVAVLPCFLLAMLFLVSVPVTVALLVVFLPIVSRDARNLAIFDPQRNTHSVFHAAAVRSLSGALAAALLAIVPGFLARLPRRAAEMVLLGESLTFLFGPGLQRVDWGGEIREAFEMGALLTGNLWWFIIPGLLILVLGWGLLLISGGLRLLLVPTENPNRAGQTTSVLATQPGAG